MHLKTQIELKDSFSINDLRNTITKSFNTENNIENVLNEMDSISSSLIAELQNFAIFGVKTNSFYYLFFQESLSIICQIEIHSKDNTFSFQLRHLYSVLNNVQRNLNRMKYSEGEFLPLRLFDSRGNDSGIIISRNTNSHSLRKGLLSPKYIELFAISLAFYIFQIYNSKQYIEKLIPTFIVALMVYIFQVFETFLSERNKISITGGSYE